MPRLVHRLPAYRLHKKSGQAIVTLDGQDRYLGPHGSAQSKAEYRRLTAEWLAAGRAAPVVAGLTVTELIARFWKHAQTYYLASAVDDAGKPIAQPAREVENYKAALKPLARLYGHTEAAAFGPLALRAMMDEMIRLGWCRNHVNRQAGRLKAVFRWAVSQELLPPAVSHALATVQGLRRGKTLARESSAVAPVPEHHITATRVHLSPTLRDMVDLQLATGMRPGEMCSMRSRDIDTTAKPWVYRPATHKTAHHGHERIIYLGPKAQAIIAPRLKPDLSAAIFSPIEAEAERRTLQRQQRKTKVQPSQILRAKRSRSRKAKRPPKEVYTVASYRRAIARACEAAFAMPAEIRAAKDDAPDVKAAKAAERRKWRAAHVWHPHQLRHNAATRLRREYGLEAAQVILGHKTLTVTQVYAERNIEEARRIMSEIG